MGIDDVILKIGDSALPRARAAGGSQDTASWGTAIVHAARKLREDDASEATADAGDNPYTEQYAMYAHGAQFVEVRVEADTCEVRVPRMVGVFAVGRVLNAKTTRSQLLGGMAWGLSMALFEESVLDPSFGDYAVDGAIVPDPEAIITGGHDNKTARTVAVRRGETINARALTAMFEQIIKNNRAGGWRKLKRTM